ncbi:uncharacterized protein LOC136068940 [Quercus suber]|uniref:uncharacterized protein LOC136068940 n=1 Tax=Quercus suber TaxID=58331 RepID=UPI0032DF68C5
MSSLTLKGKPSEQAPLASVTSSAPLTSTSSNASSVMDTPSTAPMRVSSTPDFADQPLPPSPTSTDGWGELENGIHEERENDKDGWDDIEPLEEPKPSPSLANIQAAQKRPVSQPASQPKQATSLRPKNAAKVTKHDEDDDLWDSIAAPAPKTSKPLNVRRAASADDDLWNAIAAPAPATRAQPLSSGRGRGAKPAAPRLGAQRKNQPS